MDTKKELYSILEIIKEIDFKDGEVIYPPHVKASISVSEGTGQDRFLYKIQVRDNTGKEKVVEIKIFS